MILQQWSDIFRSSLQTLWTGILDFLPEFVVAVIIFVIGWVVASLIGKVISQIIHSLRIDEALKGLKIEEVVEQAGFKLDVGGFIGGLVKWFFIVVFLVASLEVIGLDQVNEYLRGVVLVYLPRVIVAVLMLLVAVVIADAMHRIVAAAGRAARLRSANFLGSVTKWAIWIFAVLAALYQLGIAAPFVQTLFTGVVVALSIAFGLAFGLGGQDQAGKYIGRIRDEISEKN